MNSLFDEYRKDLDTAMARLKEIQAVVNGSLKEMEALVCISQECLIKAQFEVPKIEESAMVLFGRRKDD